MQLLFQWVEEKWWEGWVFLRVGLRVGSVDWAWIPLVWTGSCPLNELLLDLHMGSLCAYGA